MENSKEQFWRLLDTEHDSARTYCLKLTGNSDDGDDLYQDAILKAHNGFKKLRQVESFRGWLYRIINNSYKSRFRKAWWKKVMKFQTEPKEIDLTIDPASQYEARRRLDYAMSVLSAEDRMMFTMSELDGWKLAEIADIFSKSEGLVKMRLSRARQKMRQRLADKYRDLQDRLKREVSIKDALSSGTKETE